jgi:diguanylate cyclase (GGDEF)-like protein
MAQSAESLRTPPLTEVAQVRRLSSTLAAKHLPVLVRGVVTTFSGYKDAFFLQDRTGGIAVNRGEIGVVRAGDEVELTGVSDPGKFAASIDSQKIKVIGRGKLPPARLFTYADMVGGAEDSQWVAIHGIVESAAVVTIWNHSVLVLQVESGGGSIEVRLIRFDPGDAARLVDSLITAQGVCGTVYNDRRQFTGLRLFVPDAGNIKVIESGPADPFAAPLSPVGGVLQFGPNARAGHRVRITGTVTYQDPGRSLYVQNGSDGILLSTDQTTLAPPGTGIEAVGFPALGTYSPKLRGAVFRVLSFNQPVVPETIHADNFLKQGEAFSYVPNDGQLVHLVGRLVSPLALPTEDAWLLNDGKADFAVYLMKRPGSPPPPSIENGATLSVTGIFVVMVDDDRQPRAFHLLLRNPADLVVIERASWWTPQHLVIVLALVLSAAMATTLWSMLLRKRVWQQTQMLRESEERFRSQAQHDTLTGLASRSYLHEQLQAAIYRAGRSGKRIGLLMIDLDHFKEVNDTLGHHAGDELLRLVADRIRSSVRKTDIVARMGGDEFVVLLTDIGDSSEAELIGAKVVCSVSAPADIGEQPMLVSASVGVCTYPEGGADGDALLQNVDLAMYKAKAGGRNSFSVYTRLDCRPVLDAPARQT